MYYFCFEYSLKLLIFLVTNINWKTAEKPVWWPAQFEFKSPYGQVVGDLKQIVRGLVLHSLNASCQVRSEFKFIMKLSKGLYFIFLFFNVLKGFV